ncbi:MAG: hypothetical protein HPY60_11840 [Candidatus Methanofastidiosum sp.]|nr:hypothetical protein [Methanofastidiosum sp.]
MKDYIELNNYIREQIKMERKKKKINGVKFSKEVLGLSGGYISHLEKGVIKKIERLDLEKIFSNILEISGEELEKYINELIEESKHSDESIEQTKIINETVEPIKDDSIVYYDKNNKALTKASFKKIIDNITFKFNKSYKKNPEYAFKSLGEFTNNLSFDSGLMLALIGMPFYILKDTDFDIRQKFFDEIGDILIKYIEIYAKENNNSSDDESEEAEDSSENT